MTAKRIDAAALIELAIASLRDEVVPSLPADKRYAAAMIANALQIARREIATDTEQPLWPLLDEIYDDGDGTPRKLAADIRSGIVGESTRPGVGRKLLSTLEAELAVVNPRFLASRGAKEPL